MSLIIEFFIICSLDAIAVVVGDSSPFVVSDNMVETLDSGGALAVDNFKAKAIQPLGEPLDDQKEEELCTAGVGLTERQSALLPLGVKGMDRGEIVDERYVLLERLGSFDKTVVRYEMPLPWFVPLLSVSPKQPNHLVDVGSIASILQSGEQLKGPKKQTKWPRTRRPAHLLQYEKIELLSAPTGVHTGPLLLPDPGSTPPSCSNPLTLLDMYDETFLEAPPLGEDTDLNPADGPFVRRLQLPKPSTGGSAEHPGTDYAGDPSHKRTERQKDETRGAYRISSNTPLGRGSFGEVWRATPLTTTFDDGDENDQPDHEHERGGIHSGSWTGDSDDKDVVLKRLFGSSPDHQKQVNEFTGSTPETEAAKVTFAAANQTKTAGKTPHLESVIDSGRLSGLREVTKHLKIVIPQFYH
eukprot:GHVN01073095.1.p1 GENE.GHVN01073095.1~~GHVN01073095.1.p1  ORF type:complete len:412 (-),score=52.75 GHVN01073095.1:451-1686(-)